MTCTCRLTLAGFYHVVSCANADLPSPVDELVRDFPWRNCDGGYWRAKGVPKGEPAEMRHGDEIVREAFEFARGRR